MLPAAQTGRLSQSQAGCLLPAMLLANFHVHTVPHEEPAPEKTCTQCLQHVVHNVHFDKDHAIKKVHCPLCHFSSEVYMAATVVSVEIPHVAKAIEVSLELLLPVARVNRAMPRAPPAGFMN